jgi:hypothetical protein
MIARVDVGQRRMAANVTRTVLWSVVLIIAAAAVALLGIEISGFRYLLSD